MLRRVLADSRYFILIGVVGSFLASIALLVYGGLKTVGLIIGTFFSGAFSQTSAKYVAGALSRFSICSCWGRCSTSSRWACINCSSTTS